MDARTLTFTGVALLIVGLIWVGQGLGYIGGGFMSDSLGWVAMGVVLAIAGVLLILGARRR